jgi:integrase
VSGATLAHGELVPGSDLALAASRVQDYLRNTRAENTRKAYASDWQQFSTWCRTHALLDLPAAPATLMLYLGELAGAGKRISTLTRRVAAIAQVHRGAGFEAPGEARTVRDLLSGIRRTHGVAPQAKQALLSDDVRAMVRPLGDSLRDCRDRALLLVGFAGAFRRSELVAIRMEDLAFVEEGLVIQLRRNKTDQEGQGREVAIPLGSRPETCPVLALQGWIRRAAISSGPIFRGVSRHAHISGEALTPTAVALIVKERALAAGLDPTTCSGHSLRAGFATSAALGGAPEWAIMKQTGHRSRAMLDRYVRVAGRFRSNAVSFTGL